MTKSSKRRSLRPYFFDLIVVIAGISIAFALDNWSQNNKTKEQERLYLEAIKEDLTSDKKALMELRDSSDVLIRNLTETFQFAFTNAKVDTFQNRHITSAYTAPYFSARTGTYEALINSGDLKNISSFELKKALSDHYNVAYQEIRNADNFIRNLVDSNLYPYMLKNIQFRGRNGIVDASPLKTNEAINLMGSYFNFLTQRNISYKNLSDKCDSLIKMINTEIE